MQINFLKFATEATQPTEIAPLQVQPQEKDWRDMRVWHTTASGKRSYVKVKSLSPEEQAKYNPNLRKRVHDEEEVVDINPIVRDDDEPAGPPIEGQDAETIIPVDIDKLDYISPDQFYKVYFPDGIDRKFNVGITDSQIMGLIDIGNPESRVVLNVPINAFLEYMKDMGNWTKFDVGTDLDEKNDIISQNKFFQIYLEPFRKIIKVEEI